MKSLVLIGRLLTLVLASIPLLPLAAAEESGAVGFNRDVRPILADKCFRCHGPDEAARKAKLRLDRREDAVADRDGVVAIAPGDSLVSELVHRIATADSDDRMPPEDSGSPLADREIEILRQWIDDGAVYEQHWSFIPPIRPSLPEIADVSWPKNAIDRFVLARLESEGLKPSPAATKETLIRRVTLDLTGLPPTIKELDAFLKDTSPDAYAKVVDRLLASPHYGEKMALHWLDASRFADTNGYFRDMERTQWRWRDWVIAAFNENMPFDEFTTEQLAGDLLADASLEQKIATGFNRNHMVNNESGIIEEEFRVEYVADRLQTTSTIWLGLTTGCARCHDHKYDPLSQREYYELFAFFNNVPERGLDGGKGNAAPILSVPTKEQSARRDALDRRLKKAEEEFAPVNAAIENAQAAWEKTATKALPEPPSDGLVSHYAFESDATDSGAAKRHGEAKGAVAFETGLLGSALDLGGDGYAEIATPRRFDRDDAFSFGAWVFPTSGGPACVISKIDDANDLRGFDLLLRKGKAVAQFAHRWNSDAIQVATKNEVPTRRWQHLMVTYDGSGKAAGVRLYLDGQRQQLDILHDSLTGTIHTAEPLRIGRRQASASYEGRIDDVRIYDRALAEDETDRLATGQLVRGLIAIPSEKRSALQKQQIQEFFIARHATEVQRAAYREIAALRARVSEYKAGLPKMMVMEEMKEPRQASILARGQYDQHLEPVKAAVPAVLSPMPENAPANRLGFAQWLVSPSHPLTARVTVNRIWQSVFGTGIVATAEDFGVQGEWPSHPGLLDWLATEFIRLDWDVKELHRLIVTSATYRQSSDATPALIARDPDNRLLSRGPRFRMDAELLRDQALAVGGLLVARIGGPSVKPYQPAGLWREVTYDGELDYEPATGDDLYRRSLYTYWKRQAPPPNMLAFDAPTRETCVVKRSLTNTPLQALVLMNDPTFVEAARHLAQRMMLEGGEMDITRLIFGFRLATARSSSGEEENVLLYLLNAQRQHFRRHAAEARMLLQVGESPRDESLDPAELAAWTTVANTILSLDEVVTKH